MYMNRKLAVKVGKETVEVMEKGYYRSPSGEVVHIGRMLEQAVEGTVEYPPHRKVEWSGVGKHQTKIEVVNDTTLSAAQRLVTDGNRVAALNFASAKNPGGGFLNGARAQEESLARSSGLYACIKDCRMYSYHRFKRTCLYSNYVIYSPDVPVFRDDDGSLLDEAYLCSFLTSPAVNAGVVRKRREASLKKVNLEMKERIDKVLSLAQKNEYDALVLGAWGCGVFRNSSEDIASLFESALLGQFRGVFKHIVFAVLDSSKNKRFIEPFYDAFGESIELSPFVPIETS